MVQALIKNFWGPSFEGHPNRYYFNYKSHLADLTTDHYWPQAHAMDVIVDAYMRTQDQQYRDLYPLWWTGAPTFNFARRSKGAWWNPYVDDMEWMALAQIRMFESTGNRIFISKAREIFDDRKHYCEWSTKLGDSGFCSPLYLLSNEFSVMLYIPISLANEDILENMED